MGSRGTQAERTQLLRSAGADEAGLARVMGPIGLDIGARSPEETAIAIVAEVIALRTSSRVPSLRDGSGPIHQARP
jgi:xanthine dehydrogenase accessory factor